MFPAHVWQRPVRSITPCRGSISPPSLGRPPSVVSGYLIPPSVTDIRFNSSGLRTPNCTLLMVRSGHALSPEGGPPPCMARRARCAGANLATKSLRHRRLSAQNPSGRPPGKTSQNKKRKAGGGKGGGGEEGGRRRNEKGRKKAFFPFPEIRRLPKRKQKKGGKEEVVGGRKKKRGNE